MSSSDDILSQDKWAAEYLKRAVSAILLEVGFDTAKEGAFSKMVALLEHFLVNLCHLTKAFSEVACRTQPLVNDVILATIKMGMNVESLVAYGRRPYKVVLPNLPPIQPPPPVPKPLKLGTQLSRPFYIPDYLPEFPDAHCYIRTRVHAAPVSGYQNIRKHNAVQKRNIMQAVTHFEAMTSDMGNLFPDVQYAYPLISSRPMANPFYECTDGPLCNSKENDAVRDSVRGRSSQQKPKCDDRDSFDKVINNLYLHPVKMPPHNKATM